MKAVLPFLIWGKRQYQLLHDEIYQVLYIWRQKWFEGKPKFTISCASVPPGWSRSGDWVFFGTAPDGWVAYKQDAQTLKCLVAEMFGVDEDEIPKISPLMRQVLDDGLKELEAGLLGMLNVEALPLISEQPLEDLRTAWGSGAVMVEIKLRSIRHQLVFGGEVASNIIKKQSAQGSLSSAIRKLSSKRPLIGKYKAELECKLGEAVVQISDIMNLEVGDVIRLDQLIQQPMSIYLRDSDEPCMKAYLGRVGAHKAIHMIEM